MARLPVGYRSPFNKISSVKPSPLKIAPLALAALAAAPGLIQAGSSLFGRQKRIDEQTAAKEEMDAAKKAFMDIEYKNPYAGIQDPMANLQNPYASMENPYSENLFEDLTVDRQGADYLKQQQQQSLANTMQGLRGVAGSSGVAGLAQSMANIASGQAQKASATISEQERKNQLLRLQGEQAKRKGTFEFDKMQRKAGFDVDVSKRKSAYQTDLLTRKGEHYVEGMENKRTEDLYGLSLDRMSAADAARQQARAQGMAGLGSAVSGIAGVFAPGGIGYGRKKTAPSESTPTQSGTGFNFDIPEFGANAFGGTSGGPTLGVGLGDAFGENQGNFGYDPMTNTYRRKY